MTEQHSKILDQISRKVSEHGWTAISVSGAEDAPPFTYSVGFTETFKSPEIVFLGIAPNVAQSLLSSIASQLRDKDIRIPERNTRLSRVISDFDVGILHIEEERVKDVAKFAISYAFPNPIQLIQIILPDPSGKLPEDPGCDPDYINMQNIEFLFE